VFGALAAAVGVVALATVETAEGDSLGIAVVAADAPDAISATAAVPKESPALFRWLGLVLIVVAGAARCGASPAWTFETSARRVRPAPAVGRPPGRSPPTA
jgi:hypothetical protein